MERPNLIYIKSLSEGEKAFEEKIIHIIKMEFPEEKGLYYKNLKNKNYIQVAENVHKLKHKISILGLDNGYELATQYENNLKDNRTDLKEDFHNTLQIITEYLNKL